MNFILETTCFEYSMWIYDLWPSIHPCGVLLSHAAQCISGGRVSLLCVFTFLRMEWGKCTEVTKREINCTIGYQDPGDGRLRRNKTTRRKGLMNTGAAFFILTFWVFKNLIWLNMISAVIILIIQSISEKNPAKIGLKRGL